MNLKRDRRYIRCIRASRLGRAGLPMPGSRAPPRVRTHTWSGTWANLQRTDTGGPAYIRGSSGCQASHVIVVVVELVLDLRRHVHASDLEHGRHSTAQRMRVAFGGMALSVYVTDHTSRGNEGRHPLGPVGWVGPMAQIFIRLQGFRRFEFVNGQVSGPAPQGFITGPIQESRVAQPLGQVLLVVPGVEIGIMLDGHIGVDHHSRVRYFSTALRTPKGITRRRAIKARITAARPSRICQTPGAVLLIC